MLQAAWKRVDNWLVDYFPWWFGGLWFCSFIAFMATLPSAVCH